MKGIFSKLCAAIWQDFAHLKTGLSTHNWMYICEKVELSFSCTWYKSLVQSSGWCEKVQVAWIDHATQWVEIISEGAILKNLPNFLLNFNAIFLLILKKYFVKIQMQENKNVFQRWFQPIVQCYSHQFWKLLISKSGWLLSLDNQTIYLLLII